MSKLINFINVLIAIILISLLPGVIVFIKEKSKEGENDLNDIFDTEV